MLCACGAWQSAYLAHVWQTNNTSLQGVQDGGGPASCIRSSVSCDFQQCLKRPDILSITPRPARNCVFASTPEAAVEAVELLLLGQANALTEARLVGNQPHDWAGGVCHGSADPSGGHVCWGSSCEGH